VCWTLEVLYHGLPAGGPRLLFKGGTSLIDRFSEDIDITAFREDLKQVWWDFLSRSLEALELAVRQQVLQLAGAAVEQRHVRGATGQVGCTVARVSPRLIRSMRQPLGADARGSLLSGVDGNLAGNGSLWRHPHIQPA